MTTDTQSPDAPTIPSTDAESGAPADDILIDVRNLAKHFKISRHENLIAVGGVDLTIGRGETVGLVGESGSGKTTLGRVMLRLTEPTAGEIWYGGQRISHVSTSEFRKIRPKLQMVF